MPVVSSPSNDSLTAVAGLRTKAHRPRAPRDLVVRPRLLGLLERALECRLVLVSAPAGFGKTTLLSSWAASHDPVVWLSLDEGDDDLAAFLQALIGAIRVSAPDVARATLGLLHLPELPPPTYLARRLADDLAEEPSTLVIVLDDYHTIRAPTVHAFLTTLLFRLPEHVHLVVTSREDPPLPIGTLRARGELAEIRMGQLSFTDDEAQAFLEGSVGETRAGATDLLERTAGWPAGLRLAALAADEPVAGARPPSELAGRMAGHVREFLIDDVLASQPPDVRDIVLRTSIPDRFCGPLLDALLDHIKPAPSGEERLGALVRANLFLVPLGHEGVWFRYHDLFRDALRRKLREERGEEAIAILHERAGAWFAGRGLFEEAIRHALAAGQRDRAAVLAEEQIHLELDRDAGPAGLEGLLRQVPRELIEARPALLLARAWTLALRERYSEVPIELRSAEALLDRGGPGAEGGRSEALRGEIDALWCVIWSVQGDAQRALDAADRALERLPEGWLFARGRTALFRARALQVVGRGDEAASWLSAASAESNGADALRKGYLLTALARQQLVTLDPEGMERTARELLALGEGRQLALFTAWGHVFLGLVAYEWNELAVAHAHFLATVAHRDKLPMPVLLEGMLGLAVTRQSLDDSDSARGTLRDVAEFLHEIRSEGPLEVVRSVEARLALARGDVDVVSSLMRRGHGRPYVSYVEESRATWARLLLAQGTRAALQEAGRLVDEVEREADAEHHPLRRVRADALRALVLQAEGDADAALAVLGQAIARTHPAGLIRTFVDLGAPMQHLLAWLARRTVPADPYLERLLGAFPATTGPLEATAPSRRLAQGGLIEPLTARELDVLHLLDARLTNREIGATLYISPETAKRHLDNIYQKLQVRGRRAAVARAAALGILRTGAGRSAPALPDSAPE